jgi:hypothetical protein
MTQVSEHDGGVFPSLTALRRQLDARERRIGVAADAQPPRFHAALLQEALPRR